MSFKHSFIYRNRIEIVIGLVLFSGVGFTFFSDEWISKYGQGTSHIYIKAQVMPDQEMINLIGTIKKHLKEFNVNLWLEVA
ncbi:MULTISPECIES: hypothetical protein [unclassified Pseudoalteromonas]|uniref:hypothetical protein n=1 Tax=unclassified Pseudoalteromonas TaxID=194690 RepID=UPI00110AC5DC|nr:MULTISPECIES: hypothetical protein [unclassified Pseudoalteromonas]TMP46497.1 hypothetical protein CWB80_10075 [Pseudoalteromonas sp. S1650]TMP65999.1 hypothetical protein CWB79_13560 [Pseudoalteromonas sp. S1649]